MAKLSENQQAAVTALENTLKSSSPPAAYATIGAWKKNANGATITVKSLVAAGVVEEVIVAQTAGPLSVYRPKV